MHLSDEAKKYKNMLQEEHNKIKIDWEVFIF